ncbi:MAG: FAD-binding protein [Gemmatimonadetes bacterium]|nr:MAG: FAD-binding protein [Gemmatimonadota bacterium]
MFDTKKPISDVDVVIVGGGLAGLTAALYAGRANLRVMLLEHHTVGGHVAFMEHVDNYPGFPHGISGFQLAKAVEDHACRYRLRLVRGEVNALNIDYDGDMFVETDDHIIYGKAMVLAPGSSPRPLACPGAQRWEGQGLYYRTGIEGALFQDQIVAVIGGGDGALTHALMLGKYARQVILIHRGRALQAEAALQDQLTEYPAITTLLETEVTAVLGEEQLEGVQVRHRKTDQPDYLKVDSCVVSIGQTPNTAFLHGIVDLDENGYIWVDQRLQTSRDGIFAAGDARQYSVHTVASAVGDGSVAGINARNYVLTHSESNS